MNNNPLVSILVPVYGVEKYIERCACSLFEQTYENLEFIFVDDCTTDKSIQLLEVLLAGYPHRSSQVKILKHDKNEGLPEARRTLINNASGAFVFYVDSDDYIETDAIASLVDIQKQTNADVVTGRMFIDEDGIDSHYIEPVYKNKDEMLSTILNTIWHHEINNRLIRRSLFIDNEIEALPHVNMCEDWQLTAKVVFYANTCITATIFTYHYVSNPKSLVRSITTWTEKKNTFVQSYLAMKNLAMFFEGSSYEEKVWSFIIRSLSSNIDLCIKNHDKAFFKWCRTNLFSIPSKYYKSISRIKLACVKLGYYSTCLFLSLHQLKHLLSSKNLNLFL